jgi:hypothetical protein
VGYPKDSTLSGFAPKKKLHPDNLTGLTAERKMSIVEAVPKLQFLEQLPLKTAVL